MNIFLYKEEKKLQRYEKELEDQHKSYDRDSELIVPQLSNTEKFSVNKDFYFKAISFSANKDGYKLEFDFINDYDSIIIYDCTQVLIDGFETDVKFKETVASNDSKTLDITIPKSKLDELEINDVNMITFLGTQEYTYKGEVEKISKKIEIQFVQVIPLDNSKKGLKNIEKNDNFTISYYKTETDDDNHYIYFDIINNSKAKVNYDITINKLYVNKKIYDIEDFYTSSHYRGEKIFFIEIPKANYKKIDSMNISFTFISESKRTGKDIYITPQVSVPLS